EGLTAVDVSICSMGSPKLFPHASERSAVAFHVQDPGLGDSSRGEFSGQWTGAVRPLLDWTVERG
ncbi:MAG: ABC transporter ATP-binding protein, partial [Gaiellaceae bacterium]